MDFITPTLTTMGQNHSKELRVIKKNHYDSTMQVRNLLFALFLILLSACAKPRPTIFVDKRLAQEENVKFCFTGDMGTDSTHQQEMAEALMRENCHRLFFLGDLVYPKGIKSVNSMEFIKKFQSYYEPLLLENPQLIIGLVLGNHDHKGDPAAWLNISKIHEGFFFPNYYYMIDYGGLCVVAMDTSFYYYLSNVTEVPQQTSWIQGLQSRLKDCKVKIAMTHHPFKGRGLDAEDDWKGSSGALKLFLDSYVIGVFDIHIAGHVHVVADDGKDEGTRMLISGAGGEVRSDNRPGYIVMNWAPAQGKKISYELKFVDLETQVVQEERDPDYSHQEEHIIHKHQVEPDLLEVLWNKLKSI
jgi:predicted phosphodiesterase